MHELDKQHDDQEKKAAHAKEHSEHPKGDQKAQTEQPPAGMATDPEATRDPNYAKRIEEKTKKH
ncbi:hypothetical protein [Ktedonobacter robiniae]|uniref:Uncharacterized protein n=1 Tax=Ktedonobacter robiniae TaxID=2778365 RepID=A0ABQ3V180_9CHLR|nr:hypothetical protein [Ktedonobacter robiniae]GHO58901.1 hypothetical protein KSB_73760 [Ktedonobacter robiniae]